MAEITRFNFRPVFIKCCYFPLASPSLWNFLLRKWCCRYNYFHYPWFYPNLHFHNCCFCSLHFFCDLHGYCWFPHSYRSKCYYYSLLHYLESQNIIIIKENGNPEFFILLNELLAMLTLLISVYNLRNHFVHQMESRTIFFVFYKKIKLR